MRSTGQCEVKILVGTFKWYRAENGPKDFFPLSGIGKLPVDLQVLGTREEYLRFWRQLLLKASDSAPGYVGHDLAASALTSQRSRLAAATTLLNFLALSLFSGAAPPRDREE